jgi:hypothetical protein
MTAVRTVRLLAVFLCTTVTLVFSRKGGDMPVYFTRTSFQVLNQSVLPVDRNATGIVLDLHFFDLFDVPGQDIQF